MEPSTTYNNMCVLFTRYLFSSARKGFFGTSESSLAMSTAPENMEHDVERAAEPFHGSKEQTESSLASPVKANSLPQVSPYFISEFDFWGRN